MDVGIKFHSHYVRVVAVVSIAETVARKFRYQYDLLQDQESVGAFPIAVEGLLALLHGPAIAVSQDEVCVVHIAVMNVPLLEVLIFSLVVLLVRELLFLFVLLLR